MYTPAGYDDQSDSPRFYLNTNHPANVSGAVEGLSFCYSLNRSSGSETTTYQATIGFYRPSHERNAYSLFATINVSRSAAGNRTEFVCEDMDIPSTQVQVGDLIGVCARNFNNSRRRINFVASEVADGAELRIEEPGQELICAAVGDIPSSVSATVLTDMGSVVLLLLGVIGEC